MRILIICGSFPTQSSEDPVMPAHTGLAFALQKLGHEIRVICFTDPYDCFAGDGQYDVDGIQVYQLRPNPEKYKTWSTGVRLPLFTVITAEAHQIFSKFNSIVNDFQPDVIDCQEFNGLAYFYAQEHKYPLVIHCYGPLAHLMRSGELGTMSGIDTELVDILELATLAEADGLIACSSDVARKHSYRSGRPMNDFSIIKVPLALPDSIPQPRMQSTKGFPRLFFFGRVDRLKGAALLMDAIPAIAQKFPDFELVVAGTEPNDGNNSKTYADVMRSELKQLDLRDHVQFLGRISRAQIKQNVVDADISVFPSRYETAGYACLEAVSYGGAVVATAVGGLPEYHKHGESLWLVPPNSASDLAEGIIHLAENAALRAHLKESGPKHVAEVCAPQSIAAQTLEVYETAIGRFKKRTSPNYSFKVLGQMVNALVEQTQPLSNQGFQPAQIIQQIAPAAQNPPENKPSKQVSPKDGVVTSLSVVQNLGEMVLGHLTRVWKEGYEAGFEEGSKQQHKHVHQPRSVRSVLSAAARRVKNKLDN